MESRALQALVVIRLCWVTHLYASALLGSS